MKRVSPHLAAHRQVFRLAFRLANIPQQRALTPSDFQRKTQRRWHSCGSRMPGPRSAGCCQQYTGLSDGPSGGTKCGCFCTGAVPICVVQEAWTLHAALGALQPMRLAPPSAIARLCVLLATLCSVIAQPGVTAEAQTYTQAPVGASCASESHLTTQMLWFRSKKQGAEHSGGLVEPPPNSLTSQP